MKKLLTAPQMKFCQAYAVEKNGTAAYLLAYPGSSRAAAYSSSSDLLGKPNIRAEIARIQREVGATAKLTADRKELALAGIVEAAKGKFRGSRVLTSDRIAAIRAHNDLVGEGSEARQNDEIAALIARCRQ